MSGIGEIRPRMQVVGADGKPVGQVDRLDGGWIRLRQPAGSDDAVARRHALPLDSILRVEVDRVWLVLPADQACAMATGELTSNPGPEPGHLACSHR
ncbi:MAG: hypothetical protein JWP04_1419 [Belnapia sp.]|nr:hypothetical protein [Belnapia sp.]